MEKLNLYQKLHKIQSQVKGLGKDRDGQNYKYVTGTKVIDHIKPMMNDLGLLLKQEVLSIENTRQDYSTAKGNKSEILSKVMMKFTWIDTETGEKDENLFGANGQNDWEKGLGSALTYAERYFLLKYFHIATDEDDIDNDQRKTSAPIPLKEELTDLDWINLETIFENKKEKIDAEKFDAIKKAVYGRNPKFYEYTLATLNKL
jgi:hypothetical protein